MFVVAAIQRKQAEAAPPAAGGEKPIMFRMPLESDPHERTFMQWPSWQAIYGERRAFDEMRGVIQRIATTIARFEPVVVLARPGAVAEVAARLGSGIEVWPIPTDDLWCRDSGPTFVKSQSGALAVADLGFNGWGERQKPYADDALIARRIAERLGLPMSANGVVGEGGGVEVDGAGTAMAHESSWIGGKRNAAGRAVVERLLLEALGCERMIWAPGLAGEDLTDFHIDALARFVRPGQVVIQLGNGNNKWSRASRETYEVLKAARDAQGRRLEIADIPEPDWRKIRNRSNDFVASYVNYYVCNGAVIAPEFGDEAADAYAREKLRQLYPGREVVSLNVDALGAMGGGIHCATQQQPKVG